MKKQIKNPSKSNTKAKPILSTPKKIGLAVYFTFVFTLMGVMGLLIWLNGPNGVLNNDSLNTPPPTHEQQETLPQTQNTNTQYYNDSTQNNRSFNNYNSNSYNDYSTNENNEKQIGMSYAF